MEDLIENKIEEINETQPNSIDVRGIIINDELIFYVPNTFTPDGDTYNQTFQPIFTSGYDPLVFSMLIYNRWGELLFESTDIGSSINDLGSLVNCKYLSGILNLI